ncbi:phage major tropism determinant [Polynucleobacter sp.]|uniref:phage major tropism determinant n=1 Tax=Polynucleobacter sp. TaxID=2029855 RepID=UPI003F6958A3
MSQGSLIISDGSGAAVLAAINAALANLASMASGTTDPSTSSAGVLPYSFWADLSPLPTNPAILRQRNAANTSWIVVGVIGSDYLGLIPASKIGVASGVASLDTTGKVPLAQMYSAPTYGLFCKADPLTVCFTKTGAGAASIKAGTYVFVGSALVAFASATAISMPTLTAGTDYAIWVKDDGTLQATTSFTSTPGAGNWRKIGGFHYAPGDNASAQSGGNTTPQINAYSFWDLNFKPECPDPRGMTLVANSFWADIYLLGVDHLTNGTSKYNVTIADGSSPPKIPTLFGGSGTNAYGEFNWWEAGEVMRSWGKRLARYDEFAALAFGTTEAASIGTDQNTTQWNAAYVSRWGANQVSGVMSQWGADFGGGAAGAGWVNNAIGRGQTYQLPNAVLFGGYWGYGALAGSRCSIWYDSPTLSTYNIGARGVCDHLQLG